MTATRTMITTTTTNKAPSVITNVPKVKARSALDEHGKDGAFVRKDAVYRNWVKAGE